MKTIGLFILIQFVVPNVFAQAEISIEKLKQHLEVLAADSLEGRLTGTPGQHKATNYLVKQLQQYELVQHGAHGYQQVFYMLEDQFIEPNEDYRPEGMIQTSNVVAFIAGTDSVLNKECVVISAHYDHLGVNDGKIYNGADDNGSGTAALLELARVLKENSRNGKGCKRSFLFLWMTGEELGLYGSQYYVEHPLIPLDQTIADLNVDMIGRTDEDKGDKFRVFLIGSDRLSTELHQWSEELIQQRSDLIVDYKYNDPKEPQNLYYRSDHYNFAKNGIPSIFYFGGFHKDYHMPSDDVNKLNLEKIAAVSQLVLDTAIRLANASKRPNVDH